MRDTNWGSLTYKATLLTTRSTPAHIISFLFINNTEFGNFIVIICKLKAFACINIKGLIFFFSQPDSVHLIFTKTEIYRSFYWQLIVIYSTFCSIIAVTINQFALRKQLRRTMWRKRKRMRVDVNYYVTNEDTERMLSFK